MKSVADFVPTSLLGDIIILGQCPSTNTKPRIGSTYYRLLDWCEKVGIEEFAFHNVIPDKINSYDIKDVDEKKLCKAIKDRKIVIALGGFVERVCKKHKIDCYKIDHPSPRNRNLNDAKYERDMLKKLKAYLDEHRNN